MLNKLLHKTRLRFVTDSKGFTLIELLIVIVIIGILAGVLIAVIDPAAQQNRARDANVQATMNKFALAINAYAAAYGALPDQTQLLNGITTASALTGNGTSCTDGNVDECVFSYTNTALPTGGTAGCTTAYSGSGANQCYWRYLRSGTQYILFAKTYGRPTDTFKYTSSNSQINICTTVTDGMSGC